MYLINTSFDLFSDDHLVWALSYVQMKSVHISLIRLFKKLNILDFWNIEEASLKKYCFYLEILF